MPTTVHKILIHEPDVVENFILLTGQLSEKASEATNKDIILSLFVNIRIFQYPTDAKGKYQTFHQRSNSSTACYTEQFLLKELEEGKTKVIMIITRTMTTRILKSPLTSRKTIEGPRSKGMQVLKIKY